MEQNQMNNDEIEIDLNHYPVRACPGSGGNRRNESIYHPSVSVRNQDVCAGKTEQRYTDQRRYADQYPADKRLCRDDPEPYRYGSGHCTAWSGYDT